GLAYAVPRGYFLGPASATDPRARFGAPPRHTSSTFYRLAILPWRPVDQSEMDTPLGQLRRGSRGVPPGPVSASDPASARADLRYWRAAIVILAPQRNEDLLRVRTTALLGFAPVWTDGVWLWDVRRLRR